MVASPGAPEFADAQSNDASQAAMLIATEAGITRYLESGERFGVMADLAWKVCLALAVLLLVAWALGLLPGAVKVF